MYENDKVILQKDNIFKLVETCQSPPSIECAHSSDKYSIGSIVHMYRGRNNIKNLAPMFSLVKGPNGDHILGGKVEGWYLFIIVTLSLQHH